MYIKNCSQFYYPKNSTVNKFELRNCTSVKIVNHILMAKSKVPITGRCSISDEGRSSSYTPIYCRLLWSSARDKPRPGAARERHAIDTTIHQTQILPFTHLHCLIQFSENVQTKAICHDHTDYKKTICVRLVD